MFVQASVFFLLTHPSLRHTIPPIKYQKRWRGRVRFRAIFREPSRKWCKQGKSAETEWTSELQSESHIIVTSNRAGNCTRYHSRVTWYKSRLMY